MGKKVAFLFGAGAVENSWVPVYRCLKPIHMPEISTEGLNCLMALLVYSVRLHSKESAFHQRAVAELNKVRKNLCTQIQFCEENNQIFARTELEEIIDRFILPDMQNLMLVTTNWDTVVNEFLKNHSHIKKMIREENFCLHLHGSYKDSQTIYLPTEIIDEHYRSESEKQNFNEKHALFLRDFEKADTLVIYGLSMSPLDIELYQFLSLAINQNVQLELIKIIDLYPEKVAEKINIISHSRPIKIEGYKPSNMTTMVEYTIAS